MIKFLRIFKPPESRDDKLRRMWTRIYETDQRRKLDKEMDENLLD